MTSSIYRIHDDVHNDGVVNSIIMNNNGMDYTTAKVSFSGGNPTVEAVASAVITGTIESVTVPDHGEDVYVVGTDMATANRNGGPAGVDADLTLKIFGNIINDSNFEISSGGMNYSPNTTITIDSPDLAAGRQAKFNVTVNNGEIVGFQRVEAGTGYSQTPGFELGDIGKGVNASISIINITGNVNSIVVNNPTTNTNYESDKTTIDIGPTQSSAKAFPIINGVISSIDIINGGHGYQSAPSVIITGDGSDATATATISKISADENILNTNIEITEKMVSPGGGGVLRLYFAMIFDTSPSTIHVFKNNVNVGDLNSDNASNLINEGYYTFDLDVESGDSINFQSSLDIAKIITFRTHLVLFGA